MTAIDRRRALEVTVVALTLLLAAPATAAANGRDRGPFARALDRIVNARVGPPALSVLIQRRGLTEFHRRG